MSRFILVHMGLHGGRMGAWLQQMTNQLSSALISHFSATVRHLHLSLLPLSSSASCPFSVCVLQHCQFGSGNAIVVLHGEAPLFLPALRF